MKFAVIPWAESEFNDAFFGSYDSDGNLMLSDSYRADMYNEFFRLGHEVHTIDRYENLREVDYFLILPMDCWKWTNKLIHMGLADRLIYCNAEPPSVLKRNSPKGYKILRQIFPYILTWNSKWVDNTSIFRKHTQYRFENRFGNVPYEKRKLLTAISGNKHSKYPNELYSERDKVYAYFEKNYADHFDFYGSGWENSKDSHPCYRGYANEKEEVYHKYRFAICFENTSGLYDYVTEKILDCICAGVVPIYAGTPNIYEYVPSNCFIDYFSFSDCGELANYIVNMSEGEYSNYQNAMMNFICSDKIALFSGGLYTRDILNAIHSKKRFVLTKIGRFYVIIQTFKECIMRRKLLLTIRWARKNDNKR